MQFADKTSLETNFINLKIKQLKNTLQFTNEIKPNLEF